MAIGDFGHGECHIMVWQAIWNAVMGLGGSVVQDSTSDGTSLTIEIDGDAATFQGSHGDVIDRATAFVEQKGQERDES